VVLLLLLLVS